MIIDNVGYDVAEMAKKKEGEFVKLHLPNDAICRGRSEEDRAKYLKKVFAAIKAASGGAK